MIDAFINYLNNRGITYNRINTTSISFECLDHNYLMEYNRESDPNYFKVCLPNVESATTINDSLRQKMCRLNNTFKVAKVIEVNGGIWITAESFVFNYVSIEKLFDRIIVLLHNVLVEYRNI